MKELVISLSIAAVLLVAAFFMANVPLPPWSHWLSGVNVVLFAIPAFWVTRRWLGWRDAVGLWIVLGVYALLIETSAIYTGFPYGHFGYSDLLGAKLFDLTPWTVFLAWTPVILAAYAVAANVTKHPALRIFITSLAATSFDLILDPGAVRLGFWKYADGGWWYGVPLSNFAGWLISAALAACVIAAFLRLRKPLLPTPITLASSGWLILFFWSAIALFSGALALALLGFAMAAALAFAIIHFRYRFDEMLVLCDDAGRPTGTMPKASVHTSDTPLHLAFSIFLFNSKGELLLQQRAFSKKTWPGVWSNSCCGHQVLNESAAASAKRRLAYELGIRGAHLYLVLPDYRYRIEKDGVVENEICPVFVGFTDKDPRIEPAEVAAIRRCAWSDCLDAEGEILKTLSPWAIEEIGLLNKSGEFQRLFAEHTGRGVLS